MIKTLSQALRMDKERFKVPKSVQQAIPIQRIWPDGIFQQGTKFSKTYRFTDINCYIASKDNKTEMFLDYSELLNSLDSGISAQITINNRRINKEEFEKSILLPMKEDGLDHYREEYNEMLLSKITGTNNSIYQERYLTVSVHKRSIDDARTYFCTYRNRHRNTSGKVIVHSRRTGRREPAPDFQGLLQGRCPTGISV
mgnify:FL=1